MIRRRDASMAYRWRHGFCALCLQDTNFLGLLFRVVVDVLLEGRARGGLGRHFMRVDGVLARSGPTAVLRKRRLSTLDFRCLRRVYIDSTRPAAFCVGGQRAR